MKTHSARLIAGSLFAALTMLPLMASAQDRDRNRNWDRYRDGGHVQNDSRDRDRNADRNRDRDRARQDARRRDDDHRRDEDRRREEDRRRATWDRSWDRDRDRNWQRNWDRDRDRDRVSFGFELGGGYQDRNEWGSIAALSGAAALIGALNHDDTLTFVGGAGGLYSLYRYNEDRNSDDQAYRLRAEYFSRPYFIRDGRRYDRVQITRHGDRYYQFIRRD